MTVDTATRQLFDVPLRPAIGSRIQPTGFPDLGAATFKKPDGRDDEGNPRWRDALLVESAQSMANRLEGTAWNEPEQEPVSTIGGLPYVEVRSDEGEYLTSSRTEAHRLASAFIRHSTFDGQEMIPWIGDRLGLEDDRPLAPRQIAREVFALDPLCLVHGVFFSHSKWPGQPKIKRAVTAFVEAVDVEPAHSGGVKMDDVRHKIKEKEGSQEGYGTIPYHRTEYVAHEITASFSIDLAQIRAYGLDDTATELLADIARWEIRSLLDGGLRLRTACDLEVETGEVRDRAGDALPALGELSDRVRSGIEAVDDLLERRDPWVVTWDNA